jgi:hypothetical protein
MNAARPPTKGIGSSPPLKQKTKATFSAQPRMKSRLARFRVPGGRLVKYAAFGCSLGGFDAMNIHVTCELMAL